MSLFNSGSVRRDNLEKVADTILWLPRRVWAGRSVHVVQSEEGYNIKSNLDAKNLTQHTGSFMGSCLNTGSFAAGPAILIAIAFYALSCIAALPCLVLGLSLKKIALNRSEKAQTYSMLVKNALNQQRIQEHITLTSKYIESTSEKIKNDKEILDLFNKSPVLSSVRAMKQEKDNIEKNLPAYEKILSRYQTCLALSKERLEKQEKETSLLFEKYKNI